MANDVFISYSNIDKDAANTVCSILEEKGIKCWIAPRDITPGLPFAEAIIDGIKSSKVFILVYSSNSNRSSQVIKEVDRAVHHGLSIINLRLENIPLSKQLEYYISDVHWLDALSIPLEQYMEKLTRVVQMLLSMDDADKEYEEEAFETETIKQKQPGKQSRKFAAPKFLIPVITIFLACIILGIVWFFNRKAKIRWAREELIPKIGQMIENNDVWRNLVEPYRLAVEAEAVLGEDPDLDAIFSQCARYIDIITEPAGVSVYMKEYIDPDAEWTFLGLTPLDSMRVPVGIFRWKMEKEGYETLLAAASTWNMPISMGYDLERILHKEGSIPKGMVHVNATDIGIGSVGDFFIGRYEVTNQEYKEFIDAGGYQNQEYWKHPVLKDGNKLTWEQAMREFVDQSEQPGPSTWIGGDYPDGEGDYPVSGVSWYEASAYAEYAGMSLPTAYHWAVASGRFTPMIRAPQLGGFAVLAPFCNFGGQGPVEVGGLSGITAYGAYDMAGNVREWCSNETKAGRVIRGGSWEDNTYEFGNLRQAPVMDRSRKNGIRLAFYPDSGSVPQEAFEPVQITLPADISEIKPVPDDIYRVYKEQFGYDPSELNTVLEYSVESPGGWIREKISFDAAYGDDRVTAYLFLPENVSPPYQTVIYFPGSASTYTPSSQDIEDYYEFPMFLSYLVRNGRAVLYPVYKGTFERGKPELTAIHGGDNSHAYTEFLIQLVKDFRRCIDYLETRPDIDSSKIAFYGMSWGAIMGSIIPAVEERLSVSVLLAGGLRLKGRPEANATNYASRVKIPTLMLNGMYDSILEEGIEIMFDMLGTPGEHKKLILYETDHIPPRVEYIKETLDWLDKYLGPVR